MYISMKSACGLAALGAWSVAAGSAPLTVCREDGNCHSGQYCEVDSLTCLDCVRCEAFQRRPPLVPAACLKSVLECGPCRDGLVEGDGDVRSPCGMAGAGSAEAGARGPPYAWALAAAALLLFLVLLTLLLYLLRNTDSFKVLASTRTSVCTPGARAAESASAPELPPPYPAHYAPLGPAPPPANHRPSHFQHSPDGIYHNHDDECWSPLVKRAEEAEPGGGARESAGSQAARVYCRPAYDRGDFADASESPSGIGLPLVESDKSSPEALLDEDTVESVWTPGPSVSPPAPLTSGHITLPAILSATRATATGDPGEHEGGSAPPPAKIICIREDSNNNKSCENGEGAAPTVAGPSSSVIINVVQKFNTLHQRNDISF